MAKNQTLDERPQYSETCFTDRRSCWT